MENINNNQGLLNEIKQYIQKANNSIQSIIDDVRINNNLNNLVDLLEGLTYCFKGINLMNIESIDISIEELKQNIVEILDGVENQDFSLIADILEYEIIERIEDLNKILKNS